MAESAELDVATEVFLSDDIALDAPLDAGDLVEQIRRRTTGINERLMLPQKFVSQLTATGYSACLDECKPFPCFAEPGVIIFHALERSRERPGRTFRTKAKIDPKPSGLRHKELPLDNEVVGFE